MDADAARNDQVKFVKWSVEAAIRIGVLAIIFLVRPTTFKDRALFYVGIALMLAGVLVAIAPSLGLIWPEIFPESWGDAELGPVLLTAVIFFASSDGLNSIGNEDAL